MFQGTIRVPRWVALPVAGAIALAALAGCGLAKATEPFKDSPTTDFRNDAPAMIVQMPDGFNNAATKCLVPGIRIAVTYHHDSPYGGIAMVADKNCR